MKVLQVIHGYPMRYNAGSEVYTQTLSRGLAASGHAVHVFTREEDPFGVDFRLRREQDGPTITLHVVNHPRSRDRYREEGIDRRFAELLDELHPDVVHIGHLNHLSTSLVEEAAKRTIPIVYTLHDYWVMCPRGQLMQMHPLDPHDPWAVCEGQEDRRCAERCYARYFSGDPQERDEDVQWWTRWVARRMRHLREVASLVDLFIAPARFLQTRYIQDFGLPPERITYLDYGFDHARLSGRQRPPGEPFTFGYIGTHIAAKGIDRLISAFGQLRGSPHLRIWGRPRGQETAALQALAATLPGDAAARVEWLPEYHNERIVRDVFDRVDAIVVPSIWWENSPLVIHEALQARVPVITADVGGMAEYVQHEVNGLLFRHRDAGALAVQMQRFVDDPGWAVRLGARGYLAHPDGDVPALDDHVRQIEALYDDVRRRRQPGPWRITFDTNPDTCNLRCIMCEEHSALSDRQPLRKAAGRPPRLMPIELLRRVLAEGAAQGLREAIPSTMGEPLLYEHFDEIIDLCAQHGLKLNLTTNGTFPRRGARGWAERLVPVTSDIKVSWNGATAATHERIMPGTRWDHVLRNVQDLIAVRDAHAAGGGNRCRVTFQLTFLEHNVAELPDIIRLARSLGVDRVKGHHLWAHFEGIQEQSMRRSPDAIARWNAAVRAAQMAVAEAPLPNGRPVLLENIFTLDEQATVDLAPGGECPFLGQEAWISAEGRFDPCCAPDEQRRTLGEFGNLHEQGLMQIWQGERYQRLRRDYAAHPLCVGCNMRRPTEGT